MLRSWKLIAVMLSICISAITKEAAAAKQLELNSEDYPDSQDVLDKPRQFAPRRLRIFSPSGNSLFDKAHPRNGENKMAFELQKRMSRLSEEPERRRVEFSSDLGLPKNYFLSNWESSSNGRRFRRPFLRKSYVDGNFKMSYPPGQKRPYYYAEPEGSEFLGGPGK